MRRSRQKGPVQVRDYFERVASQVKIHKPKMSFAWQAELTQFAEEARLLLNDRN